MNPKFSAWAAQRGYEVGSAEFVAARDAWDAVLTEVAEALPAMAVTAPGGAVILDTSAAISRLHTWAAGE